MEPLRQQVTSLLYKINDLLDKPNERAAGNLKALVQGLENDLQTGKNVYAIDDRIKRIINSLNGEARDAQIMDPAHIAMLRHSFEQLRNRIHG